MKTEWYLIGALLLALAVSVGTCMHFNKQYKECRDKPIVSTTKKSDTTHAKVADSSKGSYVPKPTGYKHAHAIPHAKKDGSKLSAPMLVSELPRAGKTILPTPMSETCDTAAINDYYSTRSYTDTIKTEYGPLTIKDDISQNAIAGRSWKADFTIPVVTNTITNTVLKNRPPKKWALGVGVGYGIDPMDKMVLRPFVGVTLSRSLIRF